MGKISLVTRIQMAPLRSSLGAMQINAGMMRALEAFQEAVLMVDTKSECWTVLHVNKTFIEQTGAVPSSLVDA